MPITAYPPAIISGAKVSARTAERAGSAISATVSSAPTAAEAARANRQGPPAAGRATAQPRRRSPRRTPSRWPRSRSPSRDCPARRCRRRSVRPARPPRPGRSRGRVGRHPFPPRHRPRRPPVSSSPSRPCAGTVAARDDACESVRQRVEPGPGIVRRLPHGSARLDTLTRAEANERIRRCPTSRSTVVIRRAAGPGRTRRGEFSPFDDDDDRTQAAGNHPDDGPRSGDACVVDRTDDADAADAGRRRDRGDTARRLPDGTSVMPPATGLDRTRPRRGPAGPRCGRRDRARTTTRGSDWSPCRRPTSRAGKWWMPILVGIVALSCSACWAGAST